MIRSYDHRVHAGNAGDVWKHFLLLEAADYLLAPGSSLVYAESHVGYPEYALDMPGEWEGGIGKCWQLLPSLQNFCYFRILADLNPHGLMLYPGSTRLFMEAAGRHDSKLRAEIWDIDPGVAAAWHDSAQSAQVNFHLGDGFSGVESLLDRSPSGLLLIDPPYLDPADTKLAERLLRKAEEKDWIVLWWYMMGAETLPQSSSEIYPLQFDRVRLDCSRWSGAVVALASSGDALRRYLERRIREFLEVMRSTEPF